MTATSDDLFFDLLTARLGGTIAPTAPEQRAWDTPGKLAAEVQHNTVQTPALDEIDAALVWVASGLDRRLIVSMPPQEGKSTRVARDFVVWLLQRNAELRIVLASNDLGLARRNGRAVRDMVTNNSHLLGIRVRGDVSSQTEWQLLGHTGGVYSVGIGGSLTGRPADVLVIDDPVKSREQADSEAYRTRAWDWWTDVASTRLAPGAPVVLILTRWHEADLAGSLLAAEDGDRWRVVNIPAQADHDPEKGESDILGREPGEFMVSARGRTQEQWDAIKKSKPRRTWASLYQGHPAAIEGDLFRRTWWKLYDTPQWLVRDDGTRYVPACDDMLMSWDLSFKDTDTADYVCGQVWMRRGGNAYLLDQVLGRFDFPETMRQFRYLTAKWPQATVKLIEDKANGPAVIAALKQDPHIWGVIGEEPQGSKFARASAVTPLVEAGNVWLPDPLLESEMGTGVVPFAWVSDVIEQCASFPNAAHDDIVDALSQGLNRLVLQPLQAVRLVGVEDLDDELADFGSYVP